MAKFKVFTNCVDHYQELEIEAQDETEAEEKYQAMLENGEVLVVGSDFEEIQVTKVKED